MGGEFRQVDLRRQSGKPAHTGKEPRYRFVKGDIAEQATEPVLSDNTPTPSSTSPKATTVVCTWAWRIYPTNIRTQRLLDYPDNIRCRVCECSPTRFTAVWVAMPTTENSPIQPNNPYAATKAAADFLCGRQSTRINSTPSLPGAPIITGHISF